MSTSQVYVSPESEAAQIDLFSGCAADKGGPVHSLELHRYFGMGGREVRVV